jgi:VWFA-related protein
MRTQASEVLAPVTITDKKGRMLFDLGPEEFRVFDDGVERPIDYFELGGGAISIVLLLEGSARITPLLPDMRKSGIVFAQPVLGHTGEAAVLEYDNSVRTLVQFTTDPEPLEQAIEGVAVGSGGAKLYDAMQQGVSQLEQRPEGRRRILLVMGESQDTGSDITLGEVLRHAEIANVTIYSVGLSTARASWPSESPKATGPAPLPPLQTGDRAQDAVNRKLQKGADLTGLGAWLVQTGKNAVGVNALALACKTTGGLHLASTNGLTIEEALDEIGGEFHGQYTIGYMPPADRASGYHSIVVTVDRRGARVRTRPGYYLKAEGS